MTNRPEQLHQEVILEKETMDRVPKILIVGHGVMGTAYGKILGELGYGPDQIIVHDTDSEKLKDTDAVTPVVDMTEGLAQNPAAVFVTANTNAHLSVIEQAAPHTRNIYVEKPVVEPSQQEALRRILERHQDVRGLVGYVINASPVMEKLIDHMRRHNLHALSSIGVWAKRRGNRRPTAGNSVDEIIHMLMAHHSLVKATQEPTEFSVRSASTLFGHNGFYDSNQQAKLYGDDIKPNSTTQGTINIHTDTFRQVPLTFQSSFVAGDQVRNMTIHLGDDNGNHTHTANMHFDKRHDGTVTDTGEIVCESNNEVEAAWEAREVNKLRALTASVLRYFANPEGKNAAKVTTFDQDAFGEQMLEAIEREAKPVRIGEKY